MTPVAIAERTSLYRLFDRDGALLYVGITNNPGRRFAQHASGKRWWDQVANIELEHFADRALALEAEERAIRSVREG